jgi:hypothetical protein
MPSGKGATHYCMGSGMSLHRKLSQGLQEAGGGVGRKAWTVSKRPLGQPPVLVNKHNPIGNRYLHDALNHFSLKQG